MLFAQDITPGMIVNAVNSGPLYTMALAILILSGVVVWMAKAYRDDMKQVVKDNQVAMHETTVAIQGVTTQLSIMNERIERVEGSLEVCPHHGSVK